MMQAKESKESIAFRTETKTEEGKEEAMEIWVWGLIPQASLYDHQVTFQHLTCAN